MNQETNAQNAPSEVIDAVMTAGALKTTSVYLEGPDDPAWLRDMHTANSEAVAAIVSFDGWEDRPGGDEMSVGMNIELELMALQAQIKLGLMTPGAVRMSLKALLRLGASLSPCHPQLQDSELASDIRLSNQSRVKEIIRYVQSSTPDGAPDMMRPSRHRQFSESGYVASSCAGIFS